MPARAKRVKRRGGMRSTPQAQGLASIGEGHSTPFTGPKTRGGGGGGSRAVLGGRARSVWKLRMETQCEVSRSREEDAGAGSGRGGREDADTRSWPWAGGRARAPVGGRPSAPRVRLVLVR